MEIVLLILASLLAVVLLTGLSTYLVNRIKKDLWDAIFVALVKAKIHSKKKESQKGFTIVELLIVVAIISIIAAIAVPNLLDSDENTQVERKEACLFSECSESWNLKTYKDELCWEVSKSEYLVSDTLKNLSEEQILKVMEAREKRGFTFVSKNERAGEYYLIVKIVWRSPE